MLAWCVRMHNAWMFAALVVRSVYTLGPFFWLAIANTPGFHPLRANDAGNRYVKRKMPQLIRSGYKNMIPGSKLLGLNTKNMIPGSKHQKL